MCVGEVLRFSVDWRECEVVVVRFRERGLARVGFTVFLWDVLMRCAGSIVRGLLCVSPLSSDVV